uniref:phage tail fiber domain-containing protein n=1 Tax=Achromobacter sp. TaxID=134375 RepID=UPI0028AAB760
MTVPQNPNIRTEAVGNGVTVVFPFDFLCLEARDIQVSVSDAILSSSQYSVSGLGQLQGGTVTFVSPPAAGSPILMELAVVAARAIDYQDNGDLFAETVNFDFDRLWLAIKSAFGWLRRALVLGSYDVDGQGSYRANNNRIQDLADPAADQDAVNRRSMFAFVTDY